MKILGRFELFTQNTRVRQGFACGGLAAAGNGKGRRRSARVRFLGDPACVLVHPGGAARAPVARVCDSLVSPMESIGGPDFGR